MANKTIGQLTAKTTPSSADVFALEDTEDTKKINYDALADAILNKITSKQYTVAGQSQTLINAINVLNSKLFSEAVCTLDQSYIGTVYTNRVWTIGDMVFYAISCRVTSAIASNTEFLTFPTATLYRHDTTIMNMSGEFICDGYMAASGTRLMANGSTVQAGTDIRVTGFFRKKAS